MYFIKDMMIVMLLIPWDSHKDFIIRVILNTGIKIQIIVSHFLNLLLAFATTSILSELSAMIIATISNIQK